MAEPRNILAEPLGSAEPRLGISALEIQRDGETERRREREREKETERKRQRERDGKTETERKRL